MAVGDSPIPLRDDKATYQGLQLDPVNNVLRAYNPNLGAFQNVAMGAALASTGQVTNPLFGGLNIFAESFPLFETPTSNLAAITTDTAIGVSVRVRAGQTVSNVTFLAGDTALGTGTHQNVGLYTMVATPALISGTSGTDGTSGAWAANAYKTFALGTAYRPTVDTALYVVLTLTASQVPTLEGVSYRSTSGGPFGIQAGAAAGAYGAFTGGSSLAGVMPATITPSAVVKRPWVGLS